MKINNYYQKMNKIYNRIQDEESKVLFEARISYLLNQDLDEWTDTIMELYHDWFPSTELEAKVAEINPHGIIIFGGGYAGKMTSKMLSFWGKGAYEASYYCDTYKYGGKIDGKKVLSVDEVIQEYRNYLIIIASYKYGKEMYDELVRRDFPKSHILHPLNGILMGIRGKQYFDLFSPRPEEIYIDAGTFDGTTILDFYEWANGNYKKAYAFEPIKEMCEAIQEKIDKKKIPRIKIFNNAAWNKKEEICFTENGSGSCIDDSGEIVVQGLDIDNAVKGEKVTFIKMDIEGSELKALEGAKNTIINNRPRLAICIYHKPMDVIELASYILELVPEYKFYIRQYTSHMWETVLYAVL